VAKSKMTSIKEFEEIVGKEMFAAFMKMLADIGPDARTQRICIVIAAMLKYALDQLPADCEEGSVGEALLTVAEDPWLAEENSGVYEKLDDLVEAICKKTGIQNHRVNSRKVRYSIVENAIREYASWYNMPWEE
jgi:hypothetical protein